MIAIVADWQRIPAHDLSGAQSPAGAQWVGEGGKPQMATISQYILRCGKSTGADIAEIRAILPMPGGVGRASKSYGRDPAKDFGNLWHSVRFSSPSDRPGSRSPHDLILMRLLAGRDSIAPFVAHLPRSTTPCHVLDGPEA